MVVHDNALMFLLEGYPMSTEHFVRSRFGAYTSTRRVTRCSQAARNSGFTAAGAFFLHVELADGARKTLNKKVWRSSQYLAARPMRSQVGNCLCQLLICYCLWFYWGNVAANRAIRIWYSMVCINVGIYLSAGVPVICVGCAKSGSGLFDNGTGIESGMNGMPTSGGEGTYRTR